MAHSPTLLARAFRRVIVVSLRGVVSKKSRSMESPENEASFVVIKYSSRSLSILPYGKEGVKAKSAKIVLRQLNCFS